MANNRSFWEARLARPKRERSWEFRVIFAITLCVFLLAGIFEFLLPWKWQSKQANACQRRSVIERAADSARTCAAYAFMG